MNKTIFEFKTKADTQLSSGLFVLFGICLFLHACVVLNIAIVRSFQYVEAVYLDSIPAIVALSLTGLMILTSVLAYTVSKNKVSLCQNGENIVIKVKSFLTSYRYESPFTIQVCISHSRLPRDQHVCYQLKIDDGQGNPMTFQERIKIDFDMDFFGLKYLQPKTKAIHSYLVIENEYPNKVSELYNKIKELANSNIKDITEYNTNKKES
ncbi:MAG TPA: hypothetical protein PKV16_04910 [Caldisericia bacterium]|nr:hypothetical protein [Caldisericia bacterium]HPF48652.1 hypothetical protein [Caldisericia bacterium]HPI83688.1 hypothetical protein [Caldisericia bacterium]HPQ93107.1 hypothetical protein [Caldisericia bacterium]HRV75060.1 hypothetical protein [Caldisericia bacterium]